VIDFKLKSFSYELRFGITPLRMSFIHQEENTLGGRSVIGFSGTVPVWDILSRNPERCIWDAGLASEVPDGTEHNPNNCFIWPFLIFVFIPLSHMQMPD